MMASSAARVPGFLGRVLDAGDAPVGTCFQVAPGVFVTAWHFLNDVEAGEPNESVRLDPLAGGAPFDGRVVQVVTGARVVQVVTDDETAAACPACGVFSTSVRQRRTTRPRDLPYGETPLRVRWHKVQYACRDSGCARKAFTEQIAELPAGARLTGRLRRQVAGRVAEGAAVSTACAGLMSWPTAHAAWVGHADPRLPEPGPVEVLGIDETRRGRPTWRPAPTTGRWTRQERFETNFVDLAGPQGLLGQTAGRTAGGVVGWLDAPDHTNQSCTYTA